MLGQPRQRTSPPGQDVILPIGSELMRSALMSWVYYNPYLNISYHITGSKSLGFSIIEYPYPLCPLCRQRRERFLQYGT